MAYSPIEDKFLSALTTAQFPEEPVAEMQQPQDAAAPGEPVQVAMGGSGAGKGRTDAPMSEAAMGLFDTLAGALRGTVAQTAGFGGDVEMLARGLRSVFNRPEDQSRLDAFARGLQEKTFLPTTERMNEMMPPVVPPGAPDAARRQQTADVAGAMGEFNPLMGAPEAASMAAKGAKAIGKKLPKNVPVGASVKPVGEIPTGAPTAPTSDIGFYSAVEQAALRIQRKQGTGQAMLNDILKGENVKQDEVKWIGLDDFLKGKKSVTREEVQQYIAENKVDVQEVTLGTNPTRWEGNTLIVDNNPIGEIRDTSSGYAWKTPDGQYQLLGANRMFDAVEKVQQKIGVDVPEPSNPKYGSYTLPGGENYREILLTMPTQFERMSKPLESEIRALGLNQNLSDISLRDLMDAGASEDLQNRFEQAMRGSPEGSYHSNHWSQPNVLAHIRVNDRVDADGKKMLLVEEVQSDWHQAGRDKGYQQKTRSVPEIQKDLDSVIAELRSKPGVSYAPSEDDWARHPEISNRYDALQAELDAARQNKSGVPDAPMKDTWYQLALKRVLKYAADNGYERVGLTTGSRQAERYDLSKQVDELLYKKNADGTYRLSAQTGSRGNLLGEAITEEKLSDYVGKEIAKSIVEGSGKTANLGGSGTVSQPKDEWKSMSGIDLQVGGEGMKKYYDEIYPQFLAKYGKKWDAKVGETTVKADGAEPVRYIDITPQMRESVSKGQPLFTATGLGTGTGAATMQDKEKK